MHKTLAPTDRIAFCQARREYKTLLRNKRKEYNQSIADKLVESISDQKTFWQAMHAVPGYSTIDHMFTQVHNNISVEEWFGHFKSVLEKDVVAGMDDDVDNESVDDCANDFSFDRPIAKEEVLLAIRKLKNCKAAGPDGIIPEMLKHASDQMVNFLLNYFNVLFDEGIYPLNWCESNNTSIV